MTKVQPIRQDFDIQDAALLWNLGNNTFQIAETLRFHESVIANRLYEIRIVAKARKADGRQA